MRVGFECYFTLFHLAAALTRSWLSQAALVMSAKGLRASTELHFYSIKGVKYHL
jgi:hypothetical protein